ncbi:MAG: flagellar M-ring protein FliF [Treponema sp. CETP13]|nr:MAG: flagellar M-ring protein FliF [Treponema sp. CETP13]
MNEWFQRIFKQIRELWAKWTGVQKLIGIAIVVAIIVALVFAFTFSAHPTTVPLFNIAITDEAARDSIVYRLSEENVDAQVSSTGVISVADESTARRMRAILVREDLVPSTVDPWALFDTESWTTTDFERDVNLQRSITQVVTQHIEALDDVDNANITLTMPEDKLFSEDQNEPTASVIITAKPGSDITQSKTKIEGIQKLLIMAVEGLTAENITIADSKGNILNDFEGMADIERVDIVEKEQKLIQKLEMQYKAKVLSSLQQIFGPDRVRDLNLKIDMDMSQETATATEYSPIIIKEDNPDTPYDDSEQVESITLSSQTVDKEWKGTGYNPEGPAGVEGQNPPVYSDMSNVYGINTEKAETKNQVVNTKQIQSERSPTIDRVTVSVNIDGEWQRVYDDEGNLSIEKNGTIKRTYIPIDDEVKKQAAELIKGAIGYDSARGDLVNVTTIGYYRAAQFAEEDAAFLRQQQTRKTVIFILAGIIFILIAFIVFRFISRELERRRRLREEELLRKHQMEREQTLWEAEQAGMEVTMSVEERERAELQENAIALAHEHPEDVAMLIRSWIMEE